jgi:predicted RNA-binding protein YlqC (UPF0109 family)
MDKTRNFEALITYIVKAIVDEEDAVRVSVVEGKTTVLIELNVSDRDKGKVIGKEGNMAWAIRTIITNMATRLNKKAVLHIID